jgi:hypothetical protein
VSREMLQQEAALKTIKKKASGLPGLKRPACARLCSARSQTA